MTTGILLSAPVLVALTSSGAPISGALLQFYATGTTTAAPVYTSSALTTPLSNPVVANSAGLFPAIYLDPTVTYRAQLQTASGTLIADIDPINASPPAATQAQVNAGSLTGSYVSPATLANWSGVATALGYTPLNKAGDTASGLLINGTPASLSANSAGYLGSPINGQSSNYSLQLSDAGKTIRNSGTSAFALTIPLNASVAYPPGTVIGVRNTGAGGIITVTRTSGVTLTIAGSTTSKDVAVAAAGFATLMMEATDVWVITGTGIS
jgi:hypothetical protein